MVFFLMWRDGALEQEPADLPNVLAAGRVVPVTSQHGRRNFKDTNPLMSSLLVIFVWGGETIL
jgi:hypothetical protein